MLIALGACSRRDSRLDTAADLMYPHPDSALALLDSIDPATLAGDRNRAYYALLYSQAQNKNHIYPTSDSLINIAVDYYTGHGPDSLRMLAHFFRSVAYNNMGTYRSAVFDGLIAKDIAEQLGQDYWIARASEEIANAYLNSYDMETGIRYSDIAIIYYNRTGYILNAHYVITDKATALSHKGDYTGAIDLLDSLYNNIALLIIIYMHMF